MIYFMSTRVCTEGLFKCMTSIAGTKDKLPEQLLQLPSLLVRFIKGKRLPCLGNENDLVPLE